MTDLKKKILLIVTALFTAALLCAEGVSVAPLPANISKFPSLKYNPDSAEKDMYCPVEGTVVLEKKKGDKTTIVIKCSHTYYWKGNEQTCDYEMIISGIKDYVKAEEVDVNTVLGKITKESILVGRCTKTDPYLVLGSSYAAVIYKDLYYFHPGWLIQTTDTLSYRQIDSFEAAVLDYYSRWRNEEKDEIDRGEYHYNTLFNYPELDSICFKFKLDELPGKLDSYGSLWIISQTYFGENIWDTFTTVDSDCEYTPLLCWQKNFRLYLEDEYKPGDDIYIYGTFLALDHMEKRIVFNVRDFSVKSDEARYEERLQDITTLAK